MAPPDVLGALYAELGMTHAEAGAYFGRPPYAEPAMSHALSPMGLAGAFGPYGQLGMTGASAGASYAPAPYAELTMAHAGCNLTCAVFKNCPLN